MSGVDGRVALVVGGTSGIGLAAARALAGAGAHVTTAGLDGWDDAARVVGHRSVGRRVDVTDEADVAALITDTVGRHGRLDVLVTAAGVQRYGDATTTTTALWDEVQATNVRGTFLAVRAALPHLRASGDGAIVVVSSVQAFVTQTDVTAYTTSKAALTGLVRSLAVDEARHGVRANAVCPGSVDTPMLRSAARRFSDGSEAGEQALIEQWGGMHPLGRVATAQEVAEAVCFLAGDRAAFITGVALPVDGGLTASAPVVLPQ